MKHSIAAILSLGLFASSVSAEVIKVLIPEMECQNCSNAIKDRLKKESGISKITPDVDTKVVTIETDDSVKFSDEQIVKLVKESGFDATEVKRN